MIKVVTAATMAISLLGCEAKPEPEPKRMSGFVEVLAAPGKTDSAAIIVKVEGRTVTDGKYDLPFSLPFRGDPQKVAVFAISMSHKVLTCAIYAGKDKEPVDETVHIRSGPGNVTCGSGL